jgi:Galactose oxidase, central domain
MGATNEPELLPLVVVGKADLTVGTDNRLTLEVKSRGIVAIRIEFAVGGGVGDLGTGGVIAVNLLIDDSGDSWAPKRKDTPAGTESFYWELDEFLFPLHNDAIYTYRLDLLHIHPEKEGQAQIIVTGDSSRQISESKTLKQPKQIKKALSDGPPDLTLFTANRYSVQSGESVTFSWKPTANKDGLPKFDIDLTVVREDKTEQNIAIDDSDRRRGWKECVSPPTGDYTLTIGPKGGPHHKTLRIVSGDKSGWRQFTVPFKADAAQVAKTPLTAGVLGVFADNDSRPACLYALVAHAGSDGAGQAVLWRSENPFQNDNWKPLVPIPIDTARRPGIIFQNCLWLIGGDCCDIDRGAGEFGPIAMACYDLRLGGAHGFVPHKVHPDDEAPEARMGHTLVARDERRLWLIGGFRNSGGALNEIWEFDGSRWSRLKDGDGVFRFKNMKNEPVAGLCLASSAATSDSVWIAGGFFGEPGGVETNHELVWRFDKQTGRWHPLEKEFDYVDYKLCASTMFANGSTAVAFTRSVSERGGGSWPRHWVKLSAPDFVDIAGTLADVDGNDLFPRYEYYYHLSSAFFQGSIFVRALLPFDRVPPGRGGTPGGYTWNRPFYYYYMAGALS